MNLKRIFSLVLRIALQFRRDRRTLAMIVVAPIVILSLLSYLVNLNTSPMTVGVVLEDTSLVGLRLAEEMNDMPMFEVTEITSEDIDDLIRNGGIEAVVIIPENNAQHLTEQTVSGMKIIVNGSRSRTESTVAQGINFAINKVLMDAMGIPLQRPEVTFVYAGPEYEVIDYFAPTFIAFFAFFFTYLLTAIGFLRERTGGTLERLLASPLTKAEMVLGYITGFGMFALIQASVILIFTVYVINIHYAGNVLIVFLIVAVLAMVAVNMGIFLSTFARTELQAVQFIPLVITPQALLAGIFWPIHDMNIVFQWIAYAMPLTWANFALQEVMIKGQGIFDVNVVADVGILLLFAVVQMVLASIRLRRVSV